jgi:hypothetical protein
MRNDIKNIISELRSSQKKLEEIIDQQYSQAEKSKSLRLNALGIESGYELSRTSSQINNCIKALTKVRLI